ncbi:MAG: PAS domain S-box protein [Victivallales bacterium]|nr:PAS domain S-box protein [Victivallales bacterium]
MVKRHFMPAFSGSVINMVLIGGGVVSGAGSTVADTSGCSVAWWFPLVSVVVIGGACFLFFCCRSRRKGLIRLRRLQQKLTSAVAADGVGATAGDDDGGDELLWDVDRLVAVIRERGNELRRSEKHFRLIFEHAPIGIAVLGLNRQLRYFNPAFLRMTGYPPEMLFHRDYLQLLRRVDTPPTIEILNRLVQGELDVNTAAVRLVGKEGRIILASVTAISFRDENNRPEHLLLLVNDITGRCRQENPAAAELISPGDEMATAASAAAGTVPTGHGEMILLCEDEDHVRELASLMLTEAGYQVLTARDGEEAERLLTTYRDEIRLILLDVIMPKLSGRQVFRDLRAAGDLRPILIMTGYSPEMLQGEFGENVIQKPYTEEELLRRVREALDGAAGTVPVGE